MCVRLCTILFIADISTMDDQVLWSDMDKNIVDVLDDYFLDKELPSNFCQLDFEPPIMPEPTSTPASVAAAAAATPAMAVEDLEVLDTIDLDQLLNLNAPIAKAQVTRAEVAGPSSSSSSSADPLTETTPPAAAIPINYIISADVSALLEDFLAQQQQQLQQQQQQLQLQQQQEQQLMLDRSKICNICDMEFCSRYNLKRHKREKHRADGTELRCKDCEGKFKCERTLYEHQRYNRCHADRPVYCEKTAAGQYKCLFCENLYANMKVANYHARIKHDN